MKKRQISVLHVLVAIVLFASAAQSQPGVERIQLLGDKLFPEGIHALPGGELLVGGFGDGSIQKINSKGQVTYFSQPGQNGMVITVGMAVDTKNNRLWVANFNFQTPGGKPGSNLKVFDLKTNKLIKTIPENFIEGVFFNEVVIDKSGQVFVTNTFSPQIWTATFADSAPKVFVENELLSNPDPAQPFDLNGLALTPDGKYLIASVMDRLDAGDGRLVRIGLGDKSVTAIKLAGADAAIRAFAGSDGMFFHQNQLFMVNVFSAAGAIVTASFDSKFTTATLVLRNKLNDVYDRPTASAVRNGVLYTVNSQLNHIIDDADGQLNTPHKTPFEVVGVPLSTLLK